MSQNRPRYCIGPAGERERWLRISEGAARRMADQLAAETGQVIYVYRKQKRQSHLIYKSQPEEGQQ